MERRLPYSHWCYVCGKDNPLGFRIVFSADSGGRVRARYTPEEHRQGYLGVIHGGVLSTLLDETMGWAPALRTRRLYVTGELRVRYLNPFPIGRTMLVEGWVESLSRRMAVTGGEVRDEEGVVYAKASGKYLPMSKEETDRIQALLIYDEETIRLFE